MSRKLVLNLIIIFFLAILFPLLWVFNQRINYRKIFTLNTKFSISSNESKPSELSNPTLILKYLNEHGMQASLTPKVITNSPYGVVGRELLLKSGTLEIFEFNSKNDIARTYKDLKEETSEPNTTIYVYKNVIISFKTSDPEVRKLIESMPGAKVSN